MLPVGLHCCAHSLLHAWHAEAVDAPSAQMYEGGGGGQANHLGMTLVCMPHPYRSVLVED